MNDIRITYSYFKEHSVIRTESSERPMATFADYFRCRLIGVLLMPIPMPMPINRRVADADTDADAD